ncbi:MAG: DUF420 domain-containing protein [Planctomycetes bacterium]|nr:DUF420 domain-containing protein [Planctomycetota bacterium]
MIEVNELPAVNATLNAVAFVLLLLGYRAIRQRREHTHKRFMLAAFGVSVLFLVSYVTYHTLGEERRFGAQGWIRGVYFFILITHILLAATVPVLASVTLYLGLRGRISTHRRWARWTFPIWVYVSVTGVVVYLMLHQWYGASEALPASPSHLSAP